MSGPIIDPTWRGGSSGPWTGEGTTADSPLDAAHRSSPDPSEFVKQPREPFRRPALNEGRGNDAAQTAVMVTLQMVKMSFVAAWKTFRFMFRMFMK